MITSESFLSKSFSEDLKASEYKQRHALSRKLFLDILALCEVVSEFLTCAIVIFLASTAQLYICGRAGYSLHTPLIEGAVVGVIAVVLLRGNRGSHDWLRYDAVCETSVAIRTSLQFVAILLPAWFVWRPDLPFWAIVAGLILMPPALMLQKKVFDLMIRGLHSCGHGADRVVIYGAGETGRRAASAFLVSPRWALQPVAIIDENSQSIETCRLEMAYRERPEIAIQCASITPDLLQRFHCDLLVIATKLSGERLENLRTAARYVDVRIAYCTDDHCEEAEAREYAIQGLRFRYERTAGVTWYYICSKRIVDICLSSILLILLAPIFFLIALIIRSTSPGPALFVQRRVGRGGVFFRMYKFRSMSRRTRPYSCSPKTSRDPRITAIGRLLRRTSLDELPQLFNVFLGQMSLVGPRPEMPFIVRRYSPQQRRRLEVTPGITGLWQLSSDRAYPIHENLHHDFSYIRRRTLSLDLAILIHTLFFAMRGGV